MKHKKKYSYGTQSITAPPQGRMSPDYSSADSYLETLTNRQQAASSLATGVANTIIPGAGKVLGAVDTVSSALSKKDDGTYKSQTARTLDMALNPLSKVKGIASGNMGDVADALTFGLSSAIGINKKFGWKTSDDVYKDKKSRAESAANMQSIANSMDGTDNTQYQKFTYKKGIKSVKVSKSSK